MTQPTPEQEQQEEFDNFISKRFQCEFENLGMVFPCDLDLAWQAARAIDAQRIAELESQLNTLYEQVGNLIDHSGIRFHSNGGESFYQISHPILESVGVAHDNAIGVLAAAKRKGE